MRSREPSTGYSRGPDTLLVALVSVAIAVIALVVVMLRGLGPNYDAEHVLKGHQLVRCALRASPEDEARGRCAAVLPPALPIGDQTSERPSS